MKRLFSVILLAVMILSLVPLSMFIVSAEETDSQGVEYTLSDDGTYYIVSDCGENATEVVIPAKFDGLPVKEIGDWAFRSCGNLTSIEIPNSVTRIGKFAFSDCLSLTTIEIPDSVTSIGEAAFSFCLSLTSIEIPDSVTSIGGSTFQFCDSLTSINIPNSVTSIGHSAFYNCTSLTTIEIPDSVTSIGDEAFYDCDSLTDIYCEAESQPESWSSGWLDNCNATVHWGANISSNDKSENNFSIIANIVGVIIILIVIIMEILR